jgi:cytokinesis protein
LKERHQVRIASGQKIPDFTGSEPANGETQTDSNIATLVGSNDASTTETGLLSPPGQETDVDAQAKELQVSESEDVADRAASMLQGLRDNMDNNGERARRRRESAEEERRKRRLRRRNGGNASKDSADGSSLSIVPEPATPPPSTEASALSEPGMASPSSDENGASQPPQTPSIVVSPNADERHGSPGDEDSLDGSPKHQPTEQSD